MKLTFGNGTGTPEGQFHPVITACRGKGGGDGSDFPLTGRKNKLTKSIEHTTFPIGIDLNQVGLD